MTSPLISTIMGWGPSWAPRGWALCDNQLMAISQNTALFSLIGTIYGGDGRTTFALPDLRGRAPIGWGQGPGLSFYNIGARGGSENRTLTVMEMPSHNHSVNPTGMTVSTPASTAQADSAQPGPGKVPATVNGTAGVTPVTASVYADADTANTTLEAGVVGGAMTVGNTGGSQPFSIVQPYQTISYCMALYGIFPSRS